jgi:hypothetical protein
MRKVLLYIAGLALLLGCSDRNGLPTDQAAGNPAEKPSFAAEVDRIRLTGLDAWLLHVTPEVTFTVGLVSPIADFPDCGGTGENFVSDIKGLSQLVATPPGPVRNVPDHISGTLVLYSKSLSELNDDICALPDFLVGTGPGIFTRTDNSVTGVGPGINAFGFMANAVLDLVGGGKAKFQAVVRFLFDGENVTIVTENVKLTPIGN